MRTTRNPSAPTTSNANPSLPTDRPALPAPAIRQNRGEQLLTFTAKYFTKEILWLAAITSTALLVRCYRLEVIGLNVDEFATLRFSEPSLSFRQFISRLEGEITNPLFHYWLIWTLRGLFDDPLLALRLPSLTFGVLSIPAVHLLARRLYDNRTALIAAAITCFCYLHIEYSTIGRSYALLFLLSTLSFLFFHALLARERLRDLGLYTLATLLLVHTHYFGFFVVIAQFLGLILWIVRYRKESHRTRLIYAAVFAVVFIAGTLPIANRLMAGTDIQSFWIKTPALLYLGGTWLRHFAFDFLVSSVLAAGVLTSFVLIGRERRSPEAVSGALLLLTILTGFGLPLLYSFIQVPILHYRYTMASLPFALILAAYGISRWQLPWPPAAVFLAMGISFAESQLLIKGYALAPREGGAGLSLSPSFAPSPGTKVHFPLGNRPFRTVALELPEIGEEIFSRHARQINWYAERFGIDRRAKPLGDLKEHMKAGRPFWLLLSGHYQSDRDFVRWHRRLDNGIHDHAYHSHDRVSYPWGERRLFVAHPAKGKD